MKALNPFNTPGSPQAEQQRIRRERFKIVVWTIVGANVMLLAGLLIQGCQREPATSEIPSGNVAETASTDTNAVASTQPTSDTNSPVAPSFEPPATNAAPEASAPAVAASVPAGAKGYTVVKGDSFYKIAKANGVSVRALTDANPGVDSAKLKIGQVLQIPAGVQPAAASSASSTAPAGVEPPAHAKASAHATVSSSSGRYVVKVGDTLAKIARAHRTTVKAIKTANGLTSDRLVVGHSLKMPAAKAAAAAGA